MNRELQWHLELNLKTALLDLQLVLAEPQEIGENQPG